ncbi:MAG: rRNA pseudouridine synthase [Syntrophomonadaceae bacterium]|nr:rRNA pseudouridine synthase [Syntrophomonadaceae bacterium]
MERLQKVLAKAGIASRRHSEKIIAAGRVKVNGQVVTKPGTVVNCEQDIIEVDNQRLLRSEEKVYLLLNKPTGYVTTLRDPQGRKKIIDLVREVPQRVYPVGRLDYDTEGLLLMTNDGDLAHALTHPRYGVEKTYLVKIFGLPKPHKLKSLRQGIRLEDGMTAPAQVKLVSRLNGNALLEIKIREGRKRQIRRMCEAIGHPVMRLTRTHVDFLDLEGVKLGTYRFLTSEEIDRLKKKTEGIKPDKKKVRMGVKNGIRREERTDRSANKMRGKKISERKGY